MKVASANCFYCGKPRVVVDPTDEQLAENPPLTPCSRCKQLMEQGVILIVFDERKSGKDWQTRGKFPAPYRTGELFVAPDLWILKNLNAEAATVAVKNRWMYISDHAVRELDLKGVIDDKGQETERPADA